MTNPTTAVRWTTLYTVPLPDRILLVQKSADGCTRTVIGAWRTPR